MRQVFGLVEAANGDDLVAFFHRGDAGGLFFALLRLRTDDEEIHHHEHEEEKDPDAAERIGLLVVREDAEREERREIHEAWWL